MKKIAIIGGLGYVGLHLVKYLAPLGYEITVFSREKNNVLLDEQDQIHIRELSDGNESDNFDAVINLAYPSSYSRKKNFRSNKEIVALIKKISGKNTIVIHAGTLAVFGTGLDYPITRGRVASRRDHNYAEVKIHIENLLQHEIKDNCLHIVRLGNVWGPSAAGWLNQVADRLVFNDPIPERAKNAPSNITYIFNICDFFHYLAFEENIKPGFHFHHFAEFGDVSWGEMLGRLGNVLGCKPLYMPFQVYYPHSYIQEFGQIISPLTPKAIFYKMLNMRRLSSIAMSIVDLVPVRFRKTLKAYRDSRIPSRDTKDIVFSNRVLFEHHVDSEWKPKYSFEEAFIEVRKSLAASGYIINEELTPSGITIPEQVL